MESNWKINKKLVVSLLIIFAILKCALKKRPYTKKWKRKQNRNLKTATTIRLIKFKIFTQLEQYELKL